MRVEKYNFVVNLEDETVLKIVAKDVEDVINQLNNITNNQNNDTEPVEPDEPTEPETPDEPDNPTNPDEPDEGNSDENGDDNGDEKDTEANEVPVENIMLLRAVSPIRIRKSKRKRRKKKIEKVAIKRILRLDKVIATATELEPPVKLTTKVEAPRILNRLGQDLRLTLSATPAEAIVHPSDTITIKASTNPNFQFSHWESNSAILDNESELQYTIEGSEDIELFAVYTSALIPIKVVVKTLDNEVISDDIDVGVFSTVKSVLAGTNIELLSFSNDARYKFAYWIVNNDKITSDKIELDSYTTEDNIQLFFSKIG